MTRHFQVSTNRTGHHRVIKVRLHDTTDEMRTTYLRQYGDDPGTAQGVFITRSDWADRDPRPWQGTIWLAADHITSVVLVHEVTHAALHLYSIDGYRDHARASAHLHADNEAVPYLVGDLYSAILLRLTDLGVEVDIGMGTWYADPEHPVRLAR